MRLWTAGPQRQVDLVTTLDSDAATMARSIARLEKNGLVRRSPSPTDGRAVIVEVTDAGLALRERVERAWDALEQRTRGDLSDGHREEILRGLEDIEGNLQDELPAARRTKRSHNPTGSQR